MSSSQEGSILELVLPFTLLMLFLYIWRRTDRRQTDGSKDT